MLVVVGGIHMQGGAYLLEVAQGGRLPGARSRLREDREQERGQHRDNGDDDEQLDEGKSEWTTPPPMK